MLRCVISPFGRAVQDGAGGATAPLAPGIAPPSPRRSVVAVQFLDALPVGVLDASDIAAAAASETHRRGKLVFAHPTDLDGIRAALRAKVDILAHPPLGTPGPVAQP